MLLLLNDAADPGFPSFPVLRATEHLRLFGRLLPDCFLNQGGDPYLAALYRRWPGRLAMLPEVTVINKVGGVQRSDQQYSEPRYSRHSIGKEVMLQQLKRGTAVLQAAGFGSTAVPETARTPEHYRQQQQRQQQQQQPPAKQIAPAGPAAAGCDSGSNHDHEGPAAASKFNSAAAACNSQNPAGNSPPGCRKCSNACSQHTSAAAAAAAAATPHTYAQCANGCAASSSSSSGSSSSSSSSGGRQLAVDVLVPTARLDLDLLQGIADAVLSPAPAGCDLSLILVVDRAAADISSEQRDWLQQLQCRWLHKVRVRLNGTNAGASATRNRALQESLADYVILWDDDIRPTQDPGCLAAYVRAMQQHPEALGFAGPSYVPRCPSSLWACALHMSDCLFFWDAAADWKVADVLPWAVTANVALVNCAEEFDLRFPKTGGGEDIDYCLRVAGGRLLPVPQVRCWFEVGVMGGGE
uniref:Glycosyltransferase 2-like domain-containing protein n=1 Tax=Tetradesmus obliquus TaxID=3088 RepID=A0A383VE35_TETOB|eukprot:jgi/Sobl393_1/15311/SZX63039.1